MIRSLNYCSTCEFTVQTLEDVVVLSRAIERVLDRDDNWLIVEPLNDELDFLELWEATRQYHLDNSAMEMSVGKNSGVHTITFRLSDYLRLRFHFFPSQREKYTVWCGLLDHSTTPDSLSSIADYALISESVFNVINLKPRYETEEEYMLRVERDY